MAVAYNNMASCYLNMNQPDNVFEYIQKSISINEKLETLYINYNKRVRNSEVNTTPIPLAYHLFNT